jgi:uncharacterized integral membrane protein
VVKIIFFLLMIILGATFATVNRQEISLQYFWGWHTGPFPLYVFILTSLALGMVVGFAFGWKKRWELRAQGRDLGEKIKAVKNDLQTLTRKEDPPEVASPSPETGKPPLA